MLIFFVDPLNPLPHDIYVKALIRPAIVHDIPMALNRATVEMVLAKEVTAETQRQGTGA